ncbi:ribophorin ii [Anaeramoeba flamelloides]|uniref:Ribophorin II n=1 Tax=Anaeramoeba flamelloides TaxID=1746091 RepID=A0ABQ8XME7_9EUKA|nr:ribophorin ii [Anaeramoeba flamelloides]
MNSKNILFLSIFLFFILSTNINCSTQGLNKIITSDEQKKLIETFEKTLSSKDFKKENFQSLLQSSVGYQILSGSSIWSKIQKEDLCQEIKTFFEDFSPNSEEQYESQKAIWTTLNSLQSGSIIYNELQCHTKKKNNKINKLSPAIKELLLKSINGKSSRNIYLGGQTFFELEKTKIFNEKETDEFRKATLKSFAKMLALLEEDDPEVEFSQYILELAVLVVENYDSETSYQALADDDNDIIDESDKTESESEDDEEEYESLEGYLEMTIEELLENVLELIPDVANLLVENDGQVTQSFFNDESGKPDLEITSRVLRTFVKLKKLSIKLNKDEEEEEEDEDEDEDGDDEEIFTEEDLIGLAEFLFSRKSTQDISAAYNVITGLKSLDEDRVFKKLICITADKEELSIKQKSKKNAMNLLVSDLFGKALPADNIEVFLSRFSPVSKPEQSLTSHFLINQDRKSGQYAADLLAYRPSIGFYNLEVRVSYKPPKAGTANKKLRPFKPVDVTILTKIVGPVKVSDLEIVVKQPKSQGGSVLTRNKIKYPETLNSAKKDIVVNRDNVLSISFRVIAGQPSKSSKKQKAGFQQSINNLIETHQAMIKITDLETGIERYFLAIQKTKKYQCTIDINSNDGNMDFSSGKYNLELIIGNFFFEKSIQWNFSQIKINFGDLSEGEQKILDLSIENQKIHPDFLIKDEIKHIFNPDPKRPPKVVSNAFTGIMLIPFLLLIILLYIVGFNLKSFPSLKNPIAVITNLTFIASLAFIVLLFLAYFFKLTMFKTLFYLLIISVISSVSGYFTLRNLDK